MFLMILICMVQGIFRLNYNELCTIWEISTNDHVDFWGRIGEKIREINLESQERIDETWVIDFESMTHGE